MTLLGGAPPSGDDVDGEDAGDSGEQPGQQPPIEGAEGQAAKGAPRGGTAYRGAVAANSLLRQLNAGEQLLVERVGGQGPRGFLCSLDVDGPMRYPDDLVAALTARGCAAVGELELTLCDPLSGRLVHRVITPPLVLNAPAASPFGAMPPPSAAQAFAPAAAGDSGMAQIVAACMQGMTQMTSALAAAVAKPPGGAGAAGGGNELLEFYKVELAKRDRDLQDLREEVQALAAGGNDDEEDPVDATISTVQKLDSAGLVTRTMGDVAAAAVRETTSAEDWSGVAKVAVPGLVDLLRQVAHEIGQLSQLRLAIEAERSGIKVSIVPRSGLEAPAAAAPSAPSSGEGSSGGA